MSTKIKLKQLTKFENPGQNNQKFLSLSSVKMWQHVKVNRLLMWLKVLSFPELLRPHSKINIEFLKFYWLIELSKQRRFVLMTMARGKEVNKRNKVRSRLKTNNITSPTAVLSQDEKQKRKTRIKTYKSAHWTNIDRFIRRSKNGSEVF